MIIERGFNMMNERITDGVGKKIVEALKQQSDIEVQNVVDNAVEIDNEIEYSEPNIEDEDIIPEPIYNTMSFTPNIEKTSFASELNDMDIPTNIAVLKQLITQLPAGVSRQTGAQIIKQTMEALGISMKSVLQEAQQVQEGWNNSSKECQASVAEYRKQIGLLERQAQKYQRQSAALNEIISLFVQTNI